MHRFAARIGSAIAILVLLSTPVVRADTASYAFERASLSFSHVERTPNGTAIGVDDPAFRTLLRSLGAALTWRPGDRYVMISTSAPEIVSFAVGDVHYSVGSLTAAARFAPFLRGDEVYLPFDDTMRALGIAPQDGVLERLLTSVDVEGYGLQAVVIVRGAGLLRPRVVSDGPDRVVYAFDGVGTTLAPERSVNAGGIRTIDIAPSGSARNPVTLVTLDLQPGTRHDPPQAGSGEFEVAFGANGSAPPLLEPLRGAVAATLPPEQNAVAQATPSPTPLATESQVPSPSPSALASAPVQPNGVATVTGVTVQAGSDGSQSVTIAISGSASFEWHRLRAPDNRFWIDLHGVQLASGPQDAVEAAPLNAMRVRQLDPQTVRIALSLSGDNELSVSPSTSGVTVVVGTNEVADQARYGTGTTGQVVSANEPQALVTPVPADEYGMNSSNDQTATWKFGPRGAVNSKLIVLDPGHGGGDRGSMHGQLEEAVLTLDMAKRVQSILIARGWQVRMTRTDDSDVLATPASTEEAQRFGFRDSDAYDLQARDDIANDAGARVFVSIHCNAYINSGPSGTTVYYTKPVDLTLAQMMDRDIATSDVGTRDDGIVHAHYYVTAHATMPAILIETAFLTNPADYDRLASPDWRQKMAEAIADGIDQYMRQNPVATAR